MAKKFILTLVEHRKKKRKLTAIWSIHLPHIHPQFYLKGSNMFILPADKKAGLAVVWKDKKGNVAKVDTTLVWQSSNTAVASLQVAVDTSSAVRLGGQVGNCQISVQGDADLGEGLKPITALLDVEVIAGEAFAGELTPGALEEQ